MDYPLQILVVDDDYEDRFIMEECFKELGHSDSVQFIEDGCVLLDHLTHTQSHIVSLIVLDLNMPRLNGTETLRALKNNPQFNNIPVIIFSTSVNEIEKTNCMQLGAIEYITKPTKWDSYLHTCGAMYNMSRNPAA